MEPLACPCFELPGGKLISGACCCLSSSSVTREWWAGRTHGRGASHAAVTAGSRDRDGARVWWEGQDLGQGPIKGCSHRSCCNCRLQQCEDLEDAESLRALHGIVRGAIMLNDTSLLELLLTEDNVMDTVGTLAPAPLFFFHFPRSWCLCTHGSQGQQFT